MLKALLLSVSFCFTGLTGNLLAASLKSDSMSQQEQADKDYQDDMAIIDQASTNKDYPRIVAFGSEIEKKWAARDPGRYADLVVKTASAMHNAVSQPINTRFQDAQRLVLKALEKFNSLPIESIAKLLPYLRDEPVDNGGTGTSIKWVAQRKQNVTLWLRAWQRLETEIDRNFNPNDLPLNKVSPPKQTGLPAGVGPDAISNPRLRQQYERALLRNRRKAEAYRHQYKLRQVKEWFPQKAQAFLINSYSKPPSNGEELKGLLIRYIAKKSIRDNILDGLVKKST